MAGITVRGRLLLELGTLLADSSSSRCFWLAFAGKGVKLWDEVLRRRNTFQTIYLDLLDLFRGQLEGRGALTRRGGDRPVHAESQNEDQETESYAESDTRLVESRRTHT